MAPKTETKPLTSPTASSINVCGYYLDQDKYQFIVSEGRHDTKNKSISNPTYHMNLSQAFMEIERRMVKAEWEGPNHFMESYRGILEKLKPEWHKLTGE